MAQLLQQGHDVILDRYEAHLDTIDGLQPPDATARRLIMSEAGAILAELKESLSGDFSRNSPTTEPAVRRLTKDPAVGTIHPTDSLLAAGKLIRAITETMAPALTRFDDSPSVVTEFTVLVTETVFAHIQATSTAYAGRRLEEIRAANEEERRRISRELHDRVGNALSLALRQIEMADEQGAPRRPLGQAHRQVSDAIEIIRQVLAGLRLQSPTESLKAALDSQIDQLSLQQVRVEVTVNGDESWLSENLRSEVFLIVNEAVRNALTHSDPKNLFVSIEILPRELRATIEDDGSGFDPPPGPTGSAGGGPGSGLLSMHERAELVGARLKIHSQRRTGTRLDLIVPLAPDELVQR